MRFMDVAIFGPKDEVLTTVVTPILEDGDIWLPFS